MSAVFPNRSSRLPAPVAAPPLPRRRPIARAVAVALTLALPWAAQAMSLGVPRLNSALGQPLDLVIPMQSEDPNEIANQCVRLLPAPDADMPTLTVARVRVDRDGLITSVRVQSLEPIQEPALRVVLEVGCQRRMQREYVLLLDPPVLRAPSTAVAAAPLPPAGFPAVAPPAGLELGEPDIRAVRGRPLQIRVPLRGPDAPRLAADCVRTINDGGMPPALDNARARLLNVGSASPVLEITSRDPLNDRSVRVVTELGCERPIRREFDVLVENAPVQYEGAPMATPAPAPRRPAAERPPRPRAPATAPAVPAVPPLATAPTPAAPAPAAAPPAPATAPAATAKPADRLVLSAPEDTPAATPANPTPAPTQTDELAQQIAALATEVKRLRAELDAANARNLALTEKLTESARRTDHWNLGWALAAGASLLLAALLWLSNRRRRNASRDRRDGFDAEGPMTRIVGHRTQQAMRDSGSATLAAAPGAVGGTLMTAPLTDVRSTDSSHIQVTEMGDEEAIRELYADFVSKQSTASPTMKRDLAGPLGGGRYESARVDAGTRFGDDVPATRMTVPLTTQIAVDIDLTQDADHAAAAGLADRHAAARTRPRTGSAGARQAGAEGQRAQRKLTTAARRGAARQSLRCAAGALMIGRRQGTVRRPLRAAPCCAQRARSRCSVCALDVFAERTRRTTATRRLGSPPALLSRALRRNGSAPRPRHPTGRRHAATRG
ncbi:MAG: hypothetical protein MUC68_07215, partial [Burkholderiaceae bacterium]|nr:hypothetical protein [Burkholderiaceae bacterium]